MYFYRNFKFYRSTLAGRHYYDNRRGAPMNYLSYLISGECRIVSEGDTFHISAGNVFFVPKGLHYQSFWSGEKIDFLSLGFYELGVKEDLKTQVQVIPADPELVEQLMSIPTERGGAVTCRTLSRFYGILDRLMPQLCQREGREERIVKQAKTYISDHPRCTVPDMAAACGISEPYLYVVFKKALGTSPNEVKQQLLCEMAIDLLSATDLGVEEISDRLGFSSSAYFRKVFKKHVGQSPMAIRRMGSV